jgi:hypothetical protein
LSRLAHRGHDEPVSAIENGEGRIGLWDSGSRVRRNGFASVDPALSVIVVGEPLVDLDELNRRWTEPKYVEVMERLADFDPFPPEAR